MAANAVERSAHSVPVPRLYKFCSKVLAEYFQFKGKIPKLILQLARKEPRSMVHLANKLLFALDAELDVIKAAIENIEVMNNNPGLRYEMALVIAADMLLNEVQSKRFERPCKPVLAMLEVREQLQKEYEKCRQEAPAAGDRYKPRWVCVNTLLMSASEAKQHLAELGYSLKLCSPRSYEQFLLSARELAEHEFMEDFHFPEMLVFSPLGLRNCHLVATGKLLMQDKVSYLSPSVCGVTPGEVVIDACAAPGNKSTVLAALLNNHGKLICVELNEDRFSVLRRRVKHHGVRCASFINSDFSSLAPEQYEGVTTVLLDPSCSNSGVSLPTDEASVSGERYRRLSDMQFKLLSFALNIPSVRTVVYSTCSVNSIENENVVARALESFGEYFELEDIGSKVEGWQSFGDEDYPFASKVLRTKPEFDLCHGFFVAKFVARKENSVRESPMDVTNGVCDNEGEIEPVKIKKKKKRDKGSFLSSEIVGCEIEKNGIERCESAQDLQGFSEVAASEFAVGLQDLNEDEMNSSLCESKKEKKKKKKKKKNREEREEESLHEEENVQPERKKKKRDVTPKKKKKSMSVDDVSLSNGDENFECEMNEQNIQDDQASTLSDHQSFDSEKKKKKKRKKGDICEEENLNEKKKRKKKGIEMLLDDEGLRLEKQEQENCKAEHLNDSENIQPKKTKKKKKSENMPFQ